MPEHTTAEQKDRRRQAEAKALAFAAARILDGKKAKNVKILHVTNQTVIADYFVIAAGSSTTQVNSLADELEFQLEQKDIRPTRIEGKNSGSWILLDYGNVIAHIFSHEQRDFYKLEKLWADGEEIDFDPGQ